MNFARIQIGNVAFAAVFGTFVCAGLSRSAFSANEGVIAIDPSSLPSTDFERSFDETSRSTVLSKPKAATEPTLLPASALDRPWSLSSPAGPTAFVLERNQFEFFFGTSRMLDMLAANAFYLGANFGMTSSLLLEAGISTDVIYGSLKWNFLNPGLWSYSLRPWVGIPTKGSSDYGDYSYNTSRTTFPFGIDLISSKVVDDSHRMHMSLELGRSVEKSRWGYSSYSYSDSSYSSSYVPSGDDTTYYVARATYAYEWRLNSVSGLTFWAAEELAQSDSEPFGSGGYNSGRSSFEMGLKGGVGYESLGKHFGIFSGIAAGPRWKKVSYSDSSGSYSYQDFEAYFAGGVNYKL